MMCRSYQGLTKISDRFDLYHPAGKENTPLLKIDFPMTFLTGLPHQWLWPATSGLTTKLDVELF